jgi:hypothetical protein
VAAQAAGYQGFAIVQAAMFEAQLHVALAAASYAGRASKKHERHPRREGALLGGLSTRRSNRRQSECATKSRTGALESWGLLGWARPGWASRLSTRHGGGVQASADPGGLHHAEAHGPVCVGADLSPELSAGLRRPGSRINGGWTV